MLDTSVIISVGVEPRHFYAQLSHANMNPLKTAVLLVSGYVSEEWKRRVLEVLGRCIEELTRWGFAFVDNLVIDFSEGADVVDIATRISRRWGSVLAETREHIYLIGGGPKSISLALYILATIWRSIAKKNVRVFISLEENYAVTELPVLPLTIDLLPMEIRILKALAFHAMSRSELASLLNASYNNVQHYAKLLLKKGLVKEEGICGKRSACLKLTKIGEIFVQALAGR